MNSGADITIIIPFLNEEENIPALGSALVEYIESNSSLQYEVVLVNDGSTDNSLATIIRSQFPHKTKLINLSQNFGSHAALRAGIQQASGSYITFIYADLQDPLYLIGEMYQMATQSKKDIVWATRVTTGTRGFEKWFSGVYARLMKKFVSNRFPTNGFDIVFFNKKVTDELNRNVENNSSIFLQ